MLPTLTPTDPTLPSATAATTALDAITHVRTTLTTLASPSGLSLLPHPHPIPSATDPTLHQASLHPLSRIPLSSARRQLSTALYALKAAAVARESWEPANADRLLHVKRDTILKTTAIRSSKAALAQCRRLAATQDPFATPLQLAIHTLKAVAIASHAITTEEVPDPVPATASSDNRLAKRVLTVCGTKFLADFHFFDSPAHHFSVKVKFRHLTADDAEVPDDDIEASFAQLITDQDFDTLKRAFQKLIEQEKLSAHVSQHFSLIDALRCFEDDLIAAHQAEVDATPSDNDLSHHDRARRGHGIIKRSALGLTIDFIKGHTALLGIEDAIPNREISISRAYPTLRPDTGTFEFAETKMYSLGAQYALIFQEPILVCLSVAQSMERVGRPQSRADSTNSSKQSNDKADSSQRGDAREEQGSDGNFSLPSIQKLLAPVVFGGQDRVDPDAADVNEREGSTTAPAKEVVKRRVHWSQNSTEFVAAVALPDNQYIEFSHSGNDTVPGLAVHRVPLCHPRSVLPVFGILRQQIVFNELFQTCFGSPVYANPTLKPFQPQPIEVVLCDAPSFMQFNLYDDSMDDILSMAVTIELGGDVSVTLKSSSEKPHACSDAKATAVLRVSRNIPLTIMTIIKLGASGTGRT